MAVTISSCKDEPVVDKSNPFFTEFDTPFGVPPFDKIISYILAQNFLLASLFPAFVANT
jgi:hypothetical protein